MLLQCLFKYFICAETSSDCTWELNNTVVDYNIFILIFMYLCLYVSLRNAFQACPVAKNLLQQVSTTPVNIQSGEESQSFYPRKHGNSVTT